MSEDIRYIERTRRFYEAQGFTTPYQWAEHTDTPFHVPARPLAESRVAIVTTAIHPDDESTAMIGRKARSIPLDDVPENFFTDDLSWDKITTHTRDRASYFPLEPLASLATDGMIRDVAPRFHFVPTEYSQRFTVESDAPAIVAACGEDEVDVAVLVPL